MAVCACKRAVQCKLDLLHQGGCRCPSPQTHLLAVQTDLAVRLAVEGDHARRVRGQPGPPVDARVVEEAVGVVCGHAPAGVRAGRDCPCTSITVGMNLVLSTSMSSVRIIIAITRVPCSKHALLVERLDLQCSSSKGSHSHKSKEPNLR